MDVLLIAAAGVLAPFLVFALWRLIPSDGECDVVAGYLGQPDQTWQKNGGEVRGTSRPGRAVGNADEPSYSRRAPGPTRCGWARKGVGPGRNLNEFDSTACRFRGAPGGQAVQVDIAVRQQWPARAAVAGCGCHERLHPSQFPAGLSSMRGFSVAGSNVLPRLRAEARERCDVGPHGAGAGARRGSRTAAEKEGRWLTHPEVSSLGKELAALAAFGLLECGRESVGRD